ncbi:hypothetical protein [Sporosarcina sp. BP05]|uniref:hypothetical protein n=1 Tax=Sporosarcina sp. BP05 TaxID=2758726 RepID=UPI0016490327|nr:hypothetical protein [Sporosarcina sp. BP05]
MHWGKYAILSPPFLLFGFLFIKILPGEYKFYPVIVIIFGFWAIYDLWIFLEDKKKRRD